jgi:hypothetical protein
LAILLPLDFPGTRPSGNFQIKEGISGENPDHSLENAGILFETAFPTKSASI